MTDRPVPNVDHEGWDRRAVDREGTSLAYYRRPGDGPPLVAVHGITAWGPDLFDLASALDDYDVVVVDVRGHGRSDAPESGYDLSTAAADLRAVVEDVGFDRPILVGHSLGGGIVTTYAASHPTRAVVAVDPVGLLGGADDGDGAGADGERDVNGERRNDAGEDGERRDGERGADTGDESPPDPAEWVPALIDEGRAALDADAEAEPGSAYADHCVVGFVERAAVDPTDRYARIDAPVLVLRADVPTAERAGDDALVAAFPDARVEYVDDAGHTVHRDRPERTAALVRSFLGDAVGT